MKDAKTPDNVLNDDLYMCMLKNPSRTDNQMSTHELSSHNVHKDNSCVSPAPEARPYYENQFGNATF